MRNGFLKSPKLFIVLAVIVLAFVGYWQITNQQGPQKTIKTSTSSSTAPAKATVVLNRPFYFSIPQSGSTKNEQKITFTLLTAERKDEIKIKGEPRKPGEGHDFLLLRLELDNPSTKRIKFASADFIRLLGTGDKKYSPDFHNGTVILDPISVRRDLVSFKVDKDIKKFTLLIGELEKDKERLEIEFK